MKRIFTKKQTNTTPVISIGNLEAGGTGKTPLTIEIGKILKNLVPSLCIVSYARDRKNPDEPILLATKLHGTTVIHGRSRRTALFEAFNKKHSLIIVDDGFQYFDIKNKIDILLIDPDTQPDFLIPAGRMRFPLSFLKYADAIVINSGCFKDTGCRKMLKIIKKYSKPVFMAKHEPLYIVNIKGEKFPLKTVTEKKLLLVCGIAKPERFIRMVQNLKPASVFSAIYPDHFEYTESDIREIEEIFHSEAFDMVMTTEKDMVKLKNLYLNLPIYALSIRMEIEQYEIFAKWLTKKFYSISGKNIDL